MRASHTSHVLESRRSPRLFPLRAVLILVISAGYLGGTSINALAISCTGMEPKAAIASHDGAFVGSVAYISSPIDIEIPGQGKYKSVPVGFLVEKAIKGGLPDEIEVLFAAHQPFGPPHLRIGERGGWLLWQRDGYWRGDQICSVMSPHEMLQAGGVLPQHPPGPPTRLSQTASLVAGVGLGATFVTASVLVLRLITRRRIASPSIASSESPQ